MRLARTELQGKALEVGGTCVGASGWIPEAGTCKTVCGSMVARGGADATPGVGGHAQATSLAWHAASDDARGRCGLPKQQATSSKENAKGIYQERRRGWAFLPNNNRRKALTARAPAHSRRSDSEPALDGAVSGRASKRPGAGTARVCGRRLT